MTGFWGMGGYAVFIWPAYAMAGLGLALMALASWRRTRALTKAADALRKERRGA
jgi:heme exporter protein CcmD